MAAALSSCSHLGRAWVDRSSAVRWRSSCSVAAAASDAIRSILKVAGALQCIGAMGPGRSLGIATGFPILSFHSVIGGWAIAYLIDVIWLGLPARNHAAQSRFDALLASPSSLRSAISLSWRPYRRSWHAASPAASKRLDDDAGSGAVACRACGLFRDRKTSPAPCASCSCSTPRACAAGRA